MDNNNTSFYQKIAPLARLKMEEDSPLPFLNKLDILTDDFFARGKSKFCF